jgi:hypothetical protein
MPNKTLSVRDQDLPLWERAERVARAERTTVSALVASALAEKLGATGTCRVGTYERHTPLRIEVFEGRWLTAAPDAADLDQSGHKDWHTYVAETQRGRIAVYARSNSDSYEHPPLFEVFDDIDTARSALAGDERVDQDALIAAGYQLGRTGKRRQEVRWRDI